MLHFWKEDGGEASSVQSEDEVPFTSPAVTSWLAPLKEFATLDASIGYCFKLMIEGECCRPVFSSSGAQVGKRLT